MGGVFEMIMRLLIRKYADSGCMVKKVAIAARFGKDYLSGKRLARIGNNGGIIDGDAYLSGRRTDKHET